MLKKIDFTPEELASEEWRNVNVPEYHDYYMVSNLGRVKSLDKIITGPNGTLFTKHGKLLSVMNRNAQGYQAAQLQHKGSRIFYYVHRLVAMSFIPNTDPEHKIYVNHKDENPMNNRVSNLEWATPSENARYGTTQQRRIATNQ